MLEEKIIDYKDHEQEILHWVNLKGEYRYLTIIEFLKKKNIECTWNNVTYYIKYDKRILINSFKYIVFLEELYKSFIKKHKTINQGKLLRFEFGRALEEYLSIGDAANYDDIDLQLNHCYLIKLENSILYPSSNFTLQDNWNKGIIPKSEDINCCVT